MKEPNFSSSKLYYKYSIDFNTFVQAVSKSNTYDDLKKHLGVHDISRQALRDIIIKFDIDNSHFKGRVVQKNYDDELVNNIKNLAKESDNLKELLKKLGINSYKSQYEKIKNIIQKEKIDIRHFSKKYMQNNPNYKAHVAKIEKNIKKCKSLTEVSRLTKTPMAVLKKIITVEGIDTCPLEINKFSHNLKIREDKKKMSMDKIKNKLISNRTLVLCCNKCKLSEWENKPIPLDLHHINGLNYDNRVENLELLCPNCHRHIHAYETL